MKVLKIIVINLLVLLLIIEAASFVYFQAGLSISDYKPSYVSQTHDGKDEWMTEHHDWGAWHHPNGRAYKERRCFAMDLIANSYGARDIERSKEASASRVAVLGDSFVEGYGVDVSRRFTDLLEKESGVEYLNFGVSGNFGPAQYAIIYDQLVKQFDHDHVLIAVLPDNDFTDNDPEFWLENDKPGYDMRYRPYWKKTDTGFEIFYSVPKPEGEVFFGQYKKNVSIGPDFKQKVQRLFWAYGVYREIRYIKAGVTLTAKSYSGYFDANQTQIESAKFYLKKIKELAANKKVSFFTIPRLGDLLRLKTEKSDMVSQFTDFAKENEMAYFDLAPKMNARIEDPYSLFLPCDGHWSAKGHKVAAEILKEELELP